MFPICHIVKKIAREAAVAGALAFLCAPVQAHIGSPVKVSLASPDAPRRGEAATIYVVLQSAADVDQAEYSLVPPAGWQVIDGPTQWTGSLKSGQRLEFQMKAIPLSDEPGALQASVRVPNQLESKATLRTDRMGGQFPEKAGLEETPASKNADRSAEEVIEATFEPGAALPEPANATEPSLPGQPEKETVILEAQDAKSAKGQRSAAVSINATGRFTYLDDAGVRRPVRFATVELWNENPFPSLGDERCVKGITDTNGNFTLGANCGDLFDGPDLYVRLVLSNSVVEVKPDNVFAGTYTFRSSTRQNSAGGNVNFGTLTLTSNKDAAQAHNIIMRSHAFMSTVNENMSKVTVLWPGNGTFYTPVFNNITLDADRPFDGEGDIYHEYGHHILVTKAESPIPDYDNGVCDQPDKPGHCIFQPEKGVISWTEGWPNFFGAFMHARHTAEDGYGVTRYEFETLPTVDVTAAERDNVEGIIAGILWDLTDTANDDQGAQGPGRRDNFNMSFAQMWNVIKNFDPSDSLLHNHPTSIHELFAGFQEMQTGNINKIAEIYREHGIIKAQPDLTMTALENPPTQLPRGTTFNLSSTVRNEGNERVNAGYTVRFQLVNAANLGFTIGTRTVAANMAAGTSNTAAVNVTVPGTLTPGTYTLRACADAFGAVPEDEENNNCRVAAQTVVQ